MKKADQIKLLQAMADNNWKVGEIFERDGDLEIARVFKEQCFTLREAIRVLTKPAFAEAMYKIYFKKEERKNA